MVSCSMCIWSSYDKVKVDEITSASEQVVKVGSGGCRS